ncbi:MAG: anti-sigma factor [Actinomycetota bacterium]
MRHQLDDLIIDAGDLVSSERIADSLAQDPIHADVDPPADLWDRIAAAIAEDALEGADASSTATVTPINSHRRASSSGTGRLMLTAAAAVLVVVALGAVLFQRASSGGTELVASSDLGLLAGSGSGRAELLRDGDRSVLRVDISGLAAAGQADFFELWLLDPANGNPQPLSKFSNTDGFVEVDLPQGVSTASFPVVDISEEIDDGDATHSGKSILRGELA